MTVLAYRTELVPVIWKFMKRCHENQMWSALSGQLSYLPGDAPGWLLPLSVFCPVYKHMLMIVDNEEFYEQEKPLSIKDIKCLVVILRQALWQLLWVNPVTPPNPAKCAADVFTLKRHPLEFIQHRVSIVASDLLSQVFAYGILTLEQFLDRLVDLPLLCNHILQISHLHGTHVELIAFIEHTLARISSSHLISNGGSSSFTDPHSGSIPTTVEMVELSLGLYK